MGAIFSVRAKYQTFHKKKKTSFRGIYVTEVAITPSFPLERLLILLKTKIPKQRGMWAIAKIRHFINTHKLEVSSLFFKCLKVTEFGSYMILVCIVNNLTLLYQGTVAEAKVLIIRLEHHSNDVSVRTLF